MKVFILALILTVTLAKRNYLPNVYIGYGIDMTIGEPGNGLADPQTALRLPIFELTRSGRNQIYINGVLEIVPDQVSAVADPGMQTTSETEVYLSVFDTQKELSQAYSLNVKGIHYPWMFGASTTVTDFKENYKESGEYMAETSLVVTTYKAQILPESKNFTSDWLSISKNLPTEYNDNTCPKFKYFFEEFGTHIVTQILSGGSVFMQTTFDVSLTIEKSEQQITSDISMQFFLLTSSVQLTEQQEEQLEQLNAIYTSTTKLMGGDPSKFYVNETQQWQETVPTSPILLKYNMVPLYKFVSKDQQEALEIATAAYFDSTTVPGWDSKADYDFPLYTTTCCNYNEYVYCAGGEPVSTTATNIVLMYDPSTNMWVKKASMQYEKMQAGLVCIPSLGKIVSIGGVYGETPVNNVEMYDVVGDAWSSLASLPDKGEYAYTLGPDNVIYHNGAIFVLSTSYNSGTGLYNSLTYTFSTNKWDSCYLYEEGVPFAGFGRLFTNMKDLAIVDPSNNIWQFTFLNATYGTIEFAVMGQANSSPYGPLVQVANNLYVLGGTYNSGATYSTEVWKYDIWTNIWSLVSSLPYPNYFGFAYTATGTNIHLIGGASNHYAKNSHVTYTPVPELKYC